MSRSFIDTNVLLYPIERSRSMSLSFWDSLVVEAALRAGAGRLLTEDLQHGQRIGGLAVENPFREGAGE